MKHNGIVNLLVTLWHNINSHKEKGKKEKKKEKLQENMNGNSIH